MRHARRDWLIAKKQDLNSQFTSFGYKALDKKWDWMWL